MLELVYHWLYLPDRPIKCHLVDDVFSLTFHEIILPGCFQQLVRNRKFRFFRIILFASLSLIPFCLFCANKRENEEKCIECPQLTGSRAVNACLMSTNGAPLWNLFCLTPLWYWYWLIVNTEQLCTIAAIPRAIKSLDLRLHSSANWMLSSSNIGDNEFFWCKCCNICTRDQCVRSEKWILVFDIGTFGRLLCVARSTTDKELILNFVTISWNKYRV